MVRDSIVIGAGPAGRQLAALFCDLPRRSLGRFNARALMASSAFTGLTARGQDRRPTSDRIAPSATTGAFTDSSQSDSGPELGLLSQPQ
ncbi:hypothetical protein ROS62_26890 [Streptomyces sp. DSM 41972]|uniref:Uncharacterized protein n=1 Tax=Streptomyces althioticus subsp. attaecolombicae TaxID=3075534 RepID=A0ABU3I5T5_9ACTN|nr:hypothetical protein [Streptomyces sp. DSM 41972]